MFHVGPDLGPNCLQKILSGTLSIKQLGSRSGWMFRVGPDLGPNCLQKILSGTLSEYQTAWIQIRTDVPCWS